MCNSNPLQCANGQVWRQCGGTSGIQICTSENVDWTLQCSGDQTGMCFPGDDVFKCPDGRSICVSPNEDKIQKCLSTTTGETGSYTGIDSSSGIDDSSSDPSSIRRYF